jgi:membrane protein
MTLVEVLKETLRTFSRKGGRLLGAGIAFYSLLSAAPLLYIALRVAGAFTGEAAARAGLREDLSFWLGDEGADTAMDLVARVKRPESVTQVVAAIVLVYASTRLFSGLKRALNQIWDVPPRESAGVKGQVMRQLEKRALAFGLVLLVGIVLIGVVAVRGAFSLATGVVGRSLPLAWEALHSMGSIATTGALFALLFRVLPDVKIPWARALEGGFVTAILFALGTTLVSAYVGHKGVMQTYGQAGSLVLLLLWVHYSAQIFFLGASFMAVRMKS